VSSIDAPAKQPVVALIVAAGRGARFGADVPKQYVDMAGRPVLAWTLDRFLDHPDVDIVRVVIHANDRALYDECIPDQNRPDLLQPVPGGAERQDSVRLGLESVAMDIPDCGVVLIHDAARPFVSNQIITAVITASRDHGGALPALAVTDTIKQAKTEALDVIETTVPRARLWRAQTPQGFRFTDILGAHRSAAGQTLTDDAAVAEASGFPVLLVPGSAENIKLTTLEDLESAAMSLAPMETRTGSGFDVHRFEPGNAVTLCGVDIPHSAKLKGHSDADVGIHAICDALYGAIGAGDIGRHFPPTEARWKGAPSRVFLEHARDLIAERGGRIINIDLTVICEAPKVNPHRDAMRAVLASILGINESRINVKATTTEELGFTGRNEGIAAQATASVMVPALF